MFNILEQEHILNTHIDTLKEWWENAEDAPASPGDRIIERHVCERDEDTYYTIGVHREGMRGLIGKSGTRILARAPKPKPAWHDAPAACFEVNGRRHYVLRTERVDEGEPGIYGYDDNEAAWYYDTVEADVTPLIEARVTDEMVDRAYRAFDSGHATFRDQLREVLHVALGLDPEPAGRSTGPHLHCDAKENR